MTRRIHSSEIERLRTLPKLGDIVGGKYRIERAIGLGGMGAVFEASHLVTHKHFAIKWLLPDLDADALKRFVREAQIASRCEHPNVVEVYDLYQEDGAVFMVMELLKGESLATRLEREGQLAAGAACRIMLPCMEGLSAAHAVGIVHRDLKPANIFLCLPRGRDAEQPKVLDFGVSRLTPLPGVVESTTIQSGAIVGTPGYMAPEQLRGGAVDVRADVYSLGVTLYELLSGKRPYDGENLPDLVFNIVTGNAPPIAELVPDLPRGLALVVSRAMSPDPAARFATIEAFMRALEPFAEPIAPSLPPPSSARPRSQLRWWAALALVACVAAGVAHWRWSAASALPSAPLGDGGPAVGTRGARPTVSGDPSSGRVSAPPPPPAHEHTDEARSAGSTAPAGASAASSALGRAVERSRAQQDAGTRALLDGADKPRQSAVRVREQPRASTSAERAAIPSARDADSAAPPGRASSAQAASERASSVRPTPRARDALSARAADADRDAAVAAPASENSARVPGESGEGVPAATSPSRRPRLTLDRDGF
jgi:serine/threonine-protein kinase